MYRRDTSPYGYHHPSPSSSSPVDHDHYDNDDNNNNYDTDIAIWGQFATLEVTHSTSHDNYKPHPIQPPQLPPPLPPKPHIPFQGGSSSHDAHPPLPLPLSPPPLIFPTKPHIPFHGQSTTHQHYSNPLDAYLLSTNNNNNTNINKASTIIRGRPAVSIAIQGGLVKILIPPTDITTTIYPVIGREIFTNTKDDQKQLKFRVYQGWGSRVDQNKILGEFNLYFDDTSDNGTATTSVLRNNVVKAGSMKIQVAMRLLENGSLQAEARDLLKKTSLGWTFTPTTTV